MNEGEGKGGGDGCCENGKEEQRPKDGKEEGGPHDSLGRVETRGRVMKLLLLRWRCSSCFKEGKAARHKQCRRGRLWPVCVPV